ncbi:MAG: leucine--tRNA ligase [Candidatus Woesearchaeota archaeon]
MDYQAIEKKWQERWNKEGTFKAVPGKKNFYCLEMFPYPSHKLHMGHLRNYSIGDAIARFKRAQGFNVLYPMGYDSFGLPAENAAIKHGVNPKKWTLDNVNAIREQQKRIGLSYDWDREVVTCTPEYYKWNQWFFIKFFEKGLAYKKTSPVNWCPKCETVLANEQVEQGKCWRCHTLVTTKELSQWYLKITDYAEELLSDLKKLDEWPERVKVMQENWIGKSHGTILEFKIKGMDKTISTFTTRPDTVYGITYLVLAAEHPMVMELVKGTKHEKEVQKFVTQTRQRSIIERTAEGKEKNGIYLGKDFINPFTGEPCPLWVADYALMDYGTGAVMAVPAHDQRDFEFAKKYKLPIKVVIKPKGGGELQADKMSRAYADEGTLVNSGEFDGTPSRDAIEAITDYAEEKCYGKRTVNYKLRDWLISRQRYWGTPIPMVYCQKCGIVPIPYEQLPVILPEDVKFGTGGNPLETSKSFVETTCPKCKGKAKRETDTMDTFMDSSWYFLRYCSPKATDKPFDVKEAEQWMPVEQYIGGIEHAILHLMYARFFTKAQRDLGLLKIDEPFHRLLTQGMITKDGAKMSKSLGNTVDPAEIFEKYSADTARLFILFAALPEKEFEWSDQGVNGIFRFVQKLERLLEAEFDVKGIPKKLSQKDKFVLSKLHRAIPSVTGKIERYRFSLAIAELMDVVNAASVRWSDLDKGVRGHCLDVLSRLFQPFTPHLAEEIWEKIHGKGMVSVASWPQPEGKHVDDAIEASEALIEQTRADILSLKTLTKIEPKQITFIISPSWKYEFIKTFKTTIEETRDFKEVLQRCMTPDMKKYGKDITTMIPRFLKEPGRLPEIVTSQKIEESVLKEASAAFSKEFNVKIHIVTAEHSKEAKANNALPGKPAILFS